MADAEQMKKIVPLITCEILLCPYVCELILGVNVFDLNLGVQIDSVKQQIKSNSVGSGYMSHCWTSAFDDHFESRLRYPQKCTAFRQTEKLRVRRDVINITQFKSVVLGCNLRLVLGVLV